MVYKLNPTMVANTTSERERLHQASLLDIQRHPTHAHRNFLPRPRVKVRRHHAQPILQFQGGQIPMAAHLALTEPICDAFERGVSLIPKRLVGTHFQPRRNGVELPHCDT